MKYTFILLIILCLLMVFLMYYQNNDRISLAFSIEDGEIEEITIKGINLVNDEIFRKQLFEFLHYDSKLDYKNKYYFLSKNYIGRYFPNVKTADHYVKEMEYAEITERTNFEILNCILISENNYQIDLSYDTENEGYLQRMTVRYFFVKENGKWLYDGRDSSFIKREDLQN